jgi:hypothetical protein
VATLEYTLAAYSISDFRERVRARNYVVSYHAAEELEDDNLTIHDLENIVLTGQVVERQRDQQTEEGKYVIGGRACDGREAETVIKIGFPGTLVFITVYVL